MNIVKSVNYMRQLPPARVETEPRGPVAYVDCVTCGAKGSWKFSNGVPGPDVIHNHFKRQGWDLGKKRATCPTCIQAAREARQQRKDEKIMSTVTPFKPASDQPTASDAAKKAKRLVYMSLEEFFDDRTGQYKDGQSDRTIAELCDVSEAFVRQIREDDFGPLKMPPELQLIHDDLQNQALAIAAVEKALHAHQDAYADLKRRFDNLLVKHGWLA